MLGVQWKASMFDHNYATQKGRNDCSIKRVREFEMKERMHRYPMIVLGEIRHFTSSRRGYERGCGGWWYDHSGTA